MDNVASGRIDKRSPATRRFKLERIEGLTILLQTRGDGVLKVAVTP
ncbi:MAG: hypothetical protein ACM3L9_02610 [Deltaproteobacteria bacterium]